jgi:hypothetical protein
MSTSGKNDERRSISTSASNMAVPFLNSREFINQFLFSVPAFPIAVIKGTRDRVLHHHG